MGEPRDFYYPLQDESVDIDRVIHDLVEITDDESSVNNFVKVIDVEGQPHFSYGPVEDKAINVNRQEIPVGDGEDWVKPSEWYTQVGLSEYHIADQAEVTYKFQNVVSASQYTMWLGIKENDVIHYFTQEEYAEYLKSYTAAGSKYQSFHPLTADQITTIKSYVENPEYFDQFNITHYYGPENYNFPTRYTVGNVSFVTFIEDNGILKVLLTSLSVTSTWSSGATHYTLQLGGKTFQSQITLTLLSDKNLMLYFDRSTRITGGGQLKDAVNAIATEKEIHREDFYIDETRYFGSEFTQQPYYASQLVFGNNPNGNLEYEDSCNVTLRGKGKLFVEGNSYTHFAGNAFVKIENGAKIVARNDPDIQFLGGTFKFGENEDSYHEKNNAPYLFDVAWNTQNFIMGRRAYFIIQGSPRIAFRDNTSFDMQRHAWCSLRDESWLNMSGYAKFNMSAGASSNSGDYFANCVVTNQISADNLKFWFEGDYYQLENDTDQHHINYLTGSKDKKMEAKYFYQIIPYSQNHYINKDWVPMKGNAHNYLTVKPGGQNDYVTVYSSYFNNSIVFIKTTSGSVTDATIAEWDQEVKQIDPSLSISRYYLLQSYGYELVVNYIHDNNYDSDFANFLNRQYSYLTSDEYNYLQTLPNHPLYIYTMIVALNPMTVILDKSYSTMLDKINALNFFGFKYTLFRQDMYSVQQVCLFDSESDTASTISGAFMYLLNKNSTPTKATDNDYMYNRSDIIDYLDSKDFYISGGPYTPGSNASNSGYYINPMISEKAEKNGARTQIGTFFTVSGPNTHVVIQGDGLGADEIYIGAGSGAFIDFDITSGPQSLTQLKFGANDFGQIHYHITGDDLFVEYDHSAHIEVHDTSNFILRGYKTDSLIGARAGHRDEQWSSPKQNDGSSPVLQLYHASSFSMYGTERRDRCYITNMSFSFEINISTLQSMKDMVSGDYEKGAKALWDYLVRQDGVQERNDSVVLTDKNAIYSINDIVKEIDKNNSKFKKINPLVDIDKNNIQFTSSPQAYNPPNPNLPSGAQTAVFSLVRATRSYDDPDVYRFSVSIQNALCGDANGYRVKKYSDSPLAEIADNSEFRMWENAKFKMDNSGITLKDNSVNSDYSFTVNQLKTAIINGGASVQAGDVSYNNTSSGLAASDVQAAIDEVVTSIPVIPSTYSAANITYTNTTSGLAATNIQDAVDELAQGSSYTLPTASSNVLGGIKVGSGLAIDANGVLSLDIPTVGNTGF